MRTANYVKDANELDCLRFSVKMLRWISCNTWKLMKEVWKKPLVASIYKKLS